MTAPAIHCAHDKVWPLKKLQPNPRNPNRHPEAQLKLLAKIIIEQGWRQAIVVSKRSGLVVKGHGRLEAAKLGKLTHAPVDIQDYASEKAEFADMVADNRIAELAEMDNTQLREILDSLKVGSFDLELTGFDESALKDLLADLTPAPTTDAEPQMDKAALLNQKWKVKRGDIWKIGDHRLLCGDCANPQNVARVTGGEVTLTFTSPPYAAQRDYKGASFDWDKLMDGMMSAIAPQMDRQGSILVNLGLVHKEGRLFRYWDGWIARQDATEWPLFGWYVWDKINGLMGDHHGRLAPAHEWIFHFAHQPRRANKTAKTKYAGKGQTHYPKGKTNVRSKDGQMRGFTDVGQKVRQTKVIDSVIRCQPQRGGIEGHPAPFSVAFANTLIEVYSRPAEDVFEPFAGSGTTIVSCQNLRRRCLAIELEPDYCAVILQRMVDAFPTLAVERISDGSQ